MIEVWILNFYEDKKRVKVKAMRRDSPMNFFINFFHKRLIHVEMTVPFLSSVYTFAKKTLNFLVKKIIIFRVKKETRQSNDQWNATQAL